MKKITVIAILVAMVLLTGCSMKNGGSNSTVSGNAEVTANVTTNMTE